MQNISLDSVLSDKTLNIFTDASISKYPGTNIVTGCSGAEFYIGDKYIYTDIQVLFNTTNNHAELMSILLGVYGAVQNMQIADTINLFSDSKINVSALREWIFKWVNDRFDDTLYNSAGHPVANQKLMLSVIDIITRNNLQINIFHVRGHMNPNNPSHIDEFKRSFVTENKLSKNFKMENQLAQFLMSGNGNIDRYSRSKLYDTDYMTLAYNNIKQNMPVFNIDQKLYLQMIDFNKYKNLIGN